MAQSLRHILIAVPTMAGVMKAKTATTLVLTMRQLTRAGIETDYVNLDSSDIVFARNLFADLVVKSDTIDGLLFVDSDMHFRPALVMRMLRLGADVVAAAYPKRSLNMDRLAERLSTRPADDAEARNRLLSTTYDFTVLPSWVTPRPERIDVVKGFGKMAAAGMGCALIARSALLAMIDAGVVQRRKDIIEGVTQTRWGFFDNIQAGDVTLSEDYSFCYRWTKLLGRDLWVNLDEVVTHIGEFSYAARYIDRMARAAPVDPAAAASVQPDVVGGTLED